MENNTFGVGDQVIIRQDAVLDSGMPYHDAEFISRRDARMVGTVQQVEAGQVYVRFPTDEYGNWTILDADLLELWKPPADVIADELRLEVARLRALADRCEKRIEINDILPGEK